MLPACRIGRSRAFIDPFGKACIPPIGGARRRPANSESAVRYTRVAGCAVAPPALRDGVLRRAGETRRDIDAVSLLLLEKHELRIAARALIVAGLGGDLVSRAGDAELRLELEREVAVAVRAHGLVEHFLVHAEQPGDRRGLGHFDVHRRARRGAAAYLGRAA